jgi:hypothetical protein
MNLPNSWTLRITDKSLIPVENRVPEDVSILYSVQNGAGTHQASYPQSTGKLSLVVKSPEHEVDLSSPLSSMAASLTYRIWWLNDDLETSDIPRTLKRVS